MFTIKQVIKNSDDKPGNAVRLWEGRNPCLEFSDITGKMQVSFQMADDVFCSIDTGVVFVMNASGKTVDTFRLEGSDWF